MRSSRKRDALAATGSLALVGTLVSLSFPPRIPLAAEVSPQPVPTKIENLEIYNDFAGIPLVEYTRQAHQEATEVGMSLSLPELPWLEKHSDRLRNLARGIDQKENNAFIFPSQEQEFRAEFSRFSQAAFDLKSYGDVIRLFSDMRHNFEEAYIREGLESPVGLQYTENNTEKRMYFELVFQRLVRMELESREHALNSETLDRAIVDILGAYQAIEKGIAKAIYSASPEPSARQAQRY